MACEKEKIFALLQEANAVCNDRPTTFYIRLNGRKHYLEKLPDGASYKPRDLKYLVSQLQITPELARKHFPDLFA